MLEHCADNWTVVTVDGKRCAHFEHTIAITETGYEILTKLIRIGASRSTFPDCRVEIQNWEICYLVISSG